MINLKQKLDEIRSKQSARRASKLKGLKEERVKLEGRARIISIEKKESARIAKAQNTIRKNSFLAKAGKLYKDNVKGKIKKDGIGLGGRHDFWK